MVNWEEAAKQVPGIRLLDADEASNRVRLGVSDISKEQSVLSQTRKIGIPDSAIQFDLYPGGFSEATTLLNNVRPLMAGLQISHVWNVGDTTYCSMSDYIAISGVNYFVTASHCTRNFQGPTGVTFAQAVPGFDVGSEAINPAWSTTGCVAGDSYCSDADGALIAVNSGVTITDSIAQTSVVGSGSSAGNLTIGSKFHLYSTWDPSVGDSIYKTGRSTGTTRGKVTGMCVTIGAVGPSPLKSELCTIEAGIRVDGGDSGGQAYMFHVPFINSIRNPEGMTVAKYNNGPSEPVKAYFAHWTTLKTALGW